MKFHSPESVFAVEAVGLCEALSWIADKGLKRVTFESDSLLTVKNLSHGVITNWRLAILFRVAWIDFKKKKQFQLVYINGAKRSNKYIILHYSLLKSWGEKK